MTRSVVAVGFVLAAMVATAAVAAPADLNGRWEGVRQKSGGRTEAVAMVIDVASNSFTGVFYRDGNEYARISRGTIRGNRITFTMGDVNGEGTLESQSMKVAILFDDQTVEFTVTKKPASPPAKK